MGALDVQGFLETGQAPRAGQGSSEAKSNHTQTSWEPQRALQPSHRGTTCTWKGLRAPTVAQLGMCSGRDPSPGDPRQRPFTSWSVQEHLP